MNNTNSINEEPNYFEDTKKKLKQYIDKRILLVRLQATEKVSRIASALITIILIIIIALFLLIFGSITAGYWLSGLTGSYTTGFGIVALFYLVVFIFILLFLRKILQNFFIDKMIKFFFKKN